MGGLKIWLVAVGEPIPSDGPDERLLRTGLQARLWARAGHEVTWWNSTVDHVRKRQRSDADQVVEMEPGCQLVLLHGMLYRKNVSLRRLLNHFALAKRFKKLAAERERPDAIVCSFPPIELARAVVEFANERSIPVVVDLRDLWPEVFLDLFPKALRPFAKPLFMTMERDCRIVFSRADAIFGITEEFVELGLKKGRRARGPFDKAVPLAYDPDPVSDAELKAAFEFWREKGVEAGSNNICFFGTLGRQFQIDAVIEAARLLEAKGSALNFIVCGAGDSLESCRSKAQGLRNILFPGWMNKSQIRALMRLSKAGLAPYLPLDYFLMSVPNKAIEYLSCGLPILSGIDGVLGRLLKENRCGVVYDQSSPESLAAAAERLFADERARAEMAENAEKLYRSEFRAEEIYGRLPDLLRELVAAKAAGAKKDGLL